MTGSTGYCAPGNCFAYEVLLAGAGGRKRRGRCYSGQCRYVNWAGEKFLRK